MNDSACTHDLHDSNGEESHNLQLCIPGCLNAPDHVNRENNESNVGDDVDRANANIQGLLIDTFPRS